MNPQMPAKLQVIVDCLNSLTTPADLHELHQILSQLEIDRADVAGYCHFNPACYARNPIAATEHYELLCICWLPGQSSLIHDHTGSACGVRVVSGEMTETIFERSAGDRVRAVETKLYPVGYVCGSFDQQIHQISNFQEGEQELITLHVYSPPLAKMNNYVSEDSAAALYS